MGKRLRRRGRTWRAIRRAKQRGLGVRVRCAGELPVCDAAPRRSGRLLEYLRNLSCCRRPGVISWTLSLPLVSGELRDAASGGGASRQRFAPGRFSSAHLACSAVDGLGNRSALAGLGAGHHRRLPLGGALGCCAPPVFVVGFCHGAARLPGVRPVCFTSRGA